VLSACRENTENSGDTEQDVAAGDTEGDAVCSFRQ